MQRRKSPWLAALLNLFVPGTGYVYVGTRFRFGVLLIAAVTITLLAPPAEDATTMSRSDIEALIQDPNFMTIMAAGLLIAAAFAYDAWNDAQVHNKLIDLTEVLDETEE
ncbi:MAG: hypothetical protein WD467_02810 [Candidatus Saccharimonadales bacterium]